MVFKKKSSKKESKRIEINSREFKVNLEQLQKDVTKVYDSMKKMVPRAIRNLDIKPFGNAAHIILPKEYSGKRAMVFVTED